MIDDAVVHSPSLFGQIEPQPQLFSAVALFLNVVMTLPVYDDHCFVNTDHGSALILVRCKEKTPIRALVVWEPIFCNRWTRCDRLYGLFWEVIPLFLKISAVLTLATTENYVAIVSCRWQKRLEWAINLRVYDDHLRFG